MPATPIWDPHQYLRHAGHRTRPFLDLLGRIPDLPARDARNGEDGGGKPGQGPRIADIGCGAGNVTALLVDRWPTARITGLDNSPAMLDQAREGYAGPTPGGGLLEFQAADAAQWTPDEPYDLIVSNAALQWVPGHRASFPDWIKGLRPGGVLAFQVPGNFTGPSHRLLAELCDSPRWRRTLGDRPLRDTDMVDPADYLATLTDLGCTADVWETTYLQLLTGDDPVLDWVKGTALRPVLTALGDDAAATAEFTTQYRDLLRTAYPQGPHGTVFPFRRIFAVAHKAA